MSTDIGLAKSLVCFASHRLIVAVESL